MSISVVLFFITGALAIASGIYTIAAKNPVASAISLIFHFFMLSGLYLTLQAQFLAVIQILVYAGAIMVLVIFVIMLLNLGDEERLREKFGFQRLLAVMFSLILVLQFSIVFLSNPSSRTEMPGQTLAAGTVESIGNQLFTAYLMPFEAVGMLLLAAIIGAVVLAKRKVE
jgi:NADH-quinone oxidoreductase subunit J